MQPLDCAAGSGAANAGTAVSVGFAGLAFRLAGWTRDHAESLFAAVETVATRPLRSLVETARIAFVAAGRFWNRAGAIDAHESIAAFEKGGACCRRTRFALGSAAWCRYDEYAIHADETIAARRQGALKHGAGFAHEAAHGRGRRADVIDAKETVATIGLNDGGRQDATCFAVDLALDVGRADSAAQGARTGDGAQVTREARAASFVVEAG